MGWTHLRDTRPTARTEHECHLCLEPILAGEKYVRRVGVRDGYVINMAMHVTCEKLTQDWDEMDWETYSPGASDFRDESRAARP